MLFRSDSQVYKIVLDWFSELIRIVLVLEVLCSSSGDPLHLLFLYGGGTSHTH